MKAQNRTLRKRGGKYEEWNKEENTIYKMEFHMKKGRILKMKVARRLYPIKGYGNYEELNMELTFLRKNVRVEIYYIRMDWNGSGYFPVCTVKIPDFDFRYNIFKSSIKESVLSVFQTIVFLLKEIDKCPSTVWVLSPPS